MPEEIQSLTPKQQAFLKAKIEDPTASNRKLARKVGYAEATAVSGKVAKGFIKKAIAAILEEKGLTDDYIATKLFEGTKAFKKTYFTKEGIVTEEKIDLDFGTRLNYLELVSKMKGHYSDAPMINNTNAFQLNIEITPDDEKHIKKQLDILFRRDKKKGKR